MLLHDAIFTEISKLIIYFAPLSRAWKQNPGLYTTYFGIVEVMCYFPRSPVPFVFIPLKPLHKSNPWRFRAQGLMGDFENGPSPHPLWMRSQVHMRELACVYFTPEWLCIFPDESVAHVFSCLSGKTCKTWVIVDYFRSNGKHLDNERRS